MVSNGPSQRLYFSRKNNRRSHVLLKTDTEQGLSIDDAKERLKLFGFNAIEDAKAISPLQILANQFKSPIIFLLLFAALV